MGELIPRREELENRIQFLEIKVVEHVACPRDVEEMNRLKQEFHQLLKEWDLKIFDERRRGVSSKRTIALDLDEEHERQKKPKVFNSQDTVDPLDYPCEPHPIVSAKERVVEKQVETGKKKT